MNNPYAFVFGISEKEQSLGRIKLNFCFYLMKKKKKKVNKGIENIMNWFYINKCFLWNLQREEVQTEVIFFFF